MFIRARNRWRRCLGAIVITVLSLGALTVASVPAKARVFVSIGVPLPGVWGYYPPAPYYGYYPYYRYPVYGYPGRFFVGRTFRPRYYHHYWR